MCTAVESVNVNQPALGTITIRRKRDTNENTNFLCVPCSARYAIEYLLVFTFSLNVLRALAFLSKFAEHKEKVAE